ncbi:MAG: tripartite tricarboxylate transporter TctB family protein [Casimicrobiaceae bacterium]
MRFIRGEKDFYSGLMFAVIGAAAVIIAINYPMGQAARMGPGYFPRALGTFLMVLGAISMWRGLRVRGPAISRWKLRPVVVVLASVVVFGNVVQFLGLALSTLFLVFVASAASHEFRWKEAAFSGVLMAALCVGVFVFGLGIQLPIWPAFA